jgi:DNA-binding CsgD family transcriptional regulator
VSCGATDPSSEPARRASRIRLVSEAGDLGDADPAATRRRTPGIAEPHEGLLALTALDEFVASGAMPAPEVAERIVAELESAATEAEAPTALALARLCRSTLAGRRGDLASAVALASSARELVQAGPRTTWHPATEELFIHLADQHIRPDYKRVAQTMWQHAVETEPPQRFGVAFAAFAAVAHARDGDDRAARWAFDCVTFTLARHQHDEAEAGAAVGLAAEATFVLSDPALAARLQRLAASLIERRADFYMSHHELTLARLAAVQGQSKIAHAAFARARQALNEGGQRPLRAIVDHDEAITLAREAPRREQLLDSARKQFEALGMTVWVQRARQASSTARRDGAALTRRELEVLGLLASGLTNRQIADRLVLSVHTIERHINNLYRKLGVRNRAEATVLAIRRGL